MSTPEPPAPLGSNGFACCGGVTGHNAWCGQPPAPTPSATTKQERRPGIGMPAALLLDEFGKLVSEAFGETAYHVGSSLFSKQWRDVDVRLMLDDERYAADGYGDPEHPHQNAKWVAMVRAFAALGREMTGLPIDFQIQQTSHANAKFDGGRSALGIHTYFRRKGSTA